MSGENEKPLWAELTVVQHVRLCCSRVMHSCDSAATRHCENSWIVYVVKILLGYGMSRSFSFAITLHASAFPAFLFFLDSWATIFFGAMVASDVNIRAEMQANATTYMSLAKRNCV